MPPLAYICAAGSIGSDAIDVPAMPRSSDAQPIPLRELLRVQDIAIPRLASRFAQLAVLGAQRCLSRLATPLPRTTRVYLGTGLGDIARTDALYYEVMPPSSQLASPAQFASAGNNMAAFFVAQHAALASRNLTVSLDTLSFEQALVLALDDLAANDCTTALVGCVDETTVPREFYVRRFSLAQNHFIGEGSAWLVLGCDPANAIGEVTLACLLEPSADDGALWAQRLAKEFIGTKSSARLLAGCRLSDAAIEQLRVALPDCHRADYLPSSGYFPTAAGLALGSALVHRSQNETTLWHINRDDAGRTGLIAIMVYGVRY